MADREFLKRLEEMNGGPLRHRDERVEVEQIRRALRPLPARPPEPIVYRRDLPVTGKGVPRLPDVPPWEKVVLEEAIAGEEIEVLDRGKAYLINRTLPELDKDWEYICQRFPEELGNPNSPLQQRLANRFETRFFSPEELIFIDLETTGLSNSPLFLIGTLVWEGDGLVVRQYLARHYGEEAAITSRFIEDACGKQLLISFNGKSFDFPYVRARAVANAVPCRLHPAHFDLLHESRRIWRGKLPDCRLQTLEQHICGRGRHDDIPGYEIPEAYHDFVRTQNAARLVRILHHNMLDLITMAELMVRMPG